MSDVIRQLCALSVFCGLALMLTPEGGVKRAVQIACSVLLILSVLSTVGSFDFDSYALELARYREMGSDLAADAGERSRRLSKDLMEQEIGDYLASQAAALEIKDFHAEATLRWSTEGFWIPDHIRLTGIFDETQQRLLRERITADLGVPEKEQEWISLALESNPS